MIDFKIAVTEDYEKLVPFLIKNELEFSEEDPVPTDLVKCWEIVTGPRKFKDDTDSDNSSCKESIADSSAAEPESGELIGAFVLAKREGEFIVDGIAIDERFRKSRLGEALLKRGIREVKKLGGSQIYLVARAPGFFAKHGFKTVAREDAPNFFECLTCPQYGVDCHPEVMKLEL